MKQDPRTHVRPLRSAICPPSSIADFFERSVAGPARAKAVAVLREHWFVDRRKNGSHHLLDQAAPWSRPSRARSPSCVARARHSLRIEHFGHTQNLTKLSFDRFT
jgi:hypothetical protein